MTDAVHPMTSFLHRKSGSCHNLVHRYRSRTGPKFIVWESITYQQTEVIACYTLCRGYQKHHNTHKNIEDTRISNFALVFLCDLLQYCWGSMGPGEPTDSMGPGSYRIGIRVGAKDAQEAQVTPWGQVCQTSYLVHEARGMAAIKQWFVRFLQHRAASFHRISGAQAMPHAVKSLCCRV
jgi:hypothetical protein